MKCRAVSLFMNTPTSNQTLQPQHQTCTTSRDRPTRVVHCSWNQYLYLRRNDDRSSCSVGGVRGVHFRANGYQERFMFLGYNNRTVRNKWILKLRPAMNKSANKFRQRIKELPNIPVHASNIRLRKSVIELKKQSNAAKKSPIQAYKMYKICNLIQEI